MTLNFTLNKTSHDFVFPITIFVALFALYAYTAPRVIALYDDGQFILNSYFLSPAYPPGYPLYILIAKLATYVPVGTIAYRVHLLSALFGALTCVALWFVVKAVTESKYIALIAALAFGVSRTFWAESIIAKCYTLNSFLFFVMLYIAIMVYKISNDATNMIGRRDRNLAALGFFSILLGLALSNHWPLIVLYSIVFPYFFWNARRLIFKNLFWLLPLMLLGLSPYLWMWWRGQHPVQINAYGLLPFESLNDFISYIRRDGVADTDNDPSAALSDKIQFIALLIREWGLQYGLLGIPFILVGLHHAWQKYDKKILANLALACVAPQIIMLLKLNFSYNYLQVNIFGMYPVVSYGIASLWLAVGAVAALEATFKWIAPSERPRRKLSKKMVVIGSGVLLCAILLSNVRINERSSYDWTEQYAKLIFKLMPSNAQVFLGNESDLSVLGYYHLVEQVRPDLILYSDVNFFNNLPFGREIKYQINIDREGFTRKQSAIMDNQNAMRRKLFKLIDSSTTQIIMVNTSAMNDLLDLKNPTYGLLSEILSDANHNHFAATIFDTYQLLAIQELINTRQDITDPWTIVERSRLIRTYNYLAVCLNLQEKHRISIPVDSIAPLSAALGTVDGSLMCHNDLVAADKMLESAQSFLNADIEKITQYEYYKYRGEVQTARFGVNAKAIQYLSAAVAVYPFSDNSNNLAMQQLLKLYAIIGDSNGFYRTKNRYLKDNAPVWYAELKALLHHH